MNGLLGLLIVAGEILILRAAQRNVFTWGYLYLPRWVLNGLVRLGTVLHEASHVIACVVTGVKVTDVSWFNPTVDEERGVVMLGYVEHNVTSERKQTLIALAPLYLVPVLLLAISYFWLGSSILSDPVGTITGASLIKLVPWLWLVLSAGQAAFPSTEDDVPLFGATVFSIVVFVGLLIVGQLGTVALIMLPPALAALVLYVGLRIYVERQDQLPVGYTTAHLPGTKLVMCANPECGTVENPRDLKGEKGDLECPVCGGEEFFRVDAEGAVTQIPAQAPVPCNRCGEKGRELKLRGYWILIGSDRLVHNASGETIGTIKKPQAVCEPGYYCWKCRWLKTLLSQLKVFFHPGWLSPGTWVLKIFTLLRNIPAAVAPPYRARALGAMPIEYLQRQLDRADAEVAEDAEYRRQEIVVPPSWWMEIPQGVQRLILSGRNFYEELDVTPDASNREIEKAWRERSRESHPDVGGMDEDMKAINQAHDLLGNYHYRMAYDRLDELPEALKRQPVAV